MESVSPDFFNDAIVHWYRNILLNQGDAQGDPRLSEDIVKLK
jgi:hypothetical protein